MAQEARSKIISAVRKEPAANCEVIEDPSNHPEVCSSFDMGTSNYCYFIGQPQPDQVPLTKPDEFVFMLLPKRWIKAYLSGNTVPEWDCSLMMQLNKEPLLTHNRCVRAAIEQQVAPENPVMYAIESATHMYLLMRKDMQNSPYPKEIRHVNAHCKFSYFLIKTPEGRPNKIYRKKLSRLIVHYLLKQWVARGKLHRKWLVFYEENKAKQDDYADCFLQLYAEECIYHGVTQPSWEALELLWAELMKDPSFAETGGWPLALTAEGDRKYQSYLNRVQKALEKKDSPPPSATTKKRSSPPKNKPPSPTTSSSSNLVQSVITLDFLDLTATTATAKSPLSTPSSISEPASQKQQQQPKIPDQARSYQDLEEEDLEDFAVQPKRKKSKKNPVQEPFVIDSSTTPLQERRQLQSKLKEASSNLRKKRLEKKLRKQQLEFEPTADEYDEETAFAKAVQASLQDEQVEEATQKADVNQHPLLIRERQAYEREEQERLRKAVKPTVIDLDSSDQEDQVEDFLDVKP